MARTRSRDVSGNVGLWHLAAGIIMVLLGIYVWFNPTISLLALALYLGVAFIAVGLGYATLSFSYESGWYLLVGVLDVFVGVIFVTNLGVTAVSLPIIFALWCLAVGVIQIVSSYRRYREGYNWSWPLIAGILGVLFAFLILAYPVVAEITLTTLMGAYILLYGVVEIVEYVAQRNAAVSANNV